MERRLLKFFAVVGVLALSGCVKNSFDMNMLSKMAHISPTLAISAVKGDVSFSDIVESSDTVRFGEDNFVTLVFVLESVLNLKPGDFSPVRNMINYYGNGFSQPDQNLINQGSGDEKSYLGQWVALIDPDTLDLGIEDILNHISGEILVSNPSIIFNYTNSFVDPILLDLRASGKRQTSTIDLELAPFELNHPADTLQAPVSSTFIIDKNNSSLPELISMPPEMIWFSGKAVINVSTEYAHNDLTTDRTLAGSVEVDIPLEFRVHNLQFTDTTDNFLADAFDEGSSLNWADFELFRIDFDVKNGFPWGVSLKMDLCDSITHEKISSIESPNVLTPAPVDSNGKVTEVAASAASLTFTEEFFNSIERSDKIIFRFTMNTSENGTKDVKIYSDYKIEFTASLVLKPDIRINLK